MRETVSPIANSVLFERQRNKRLHYGNEIYECPLVVYDLLFELIFRQAAVELNYV